MSGMPAGPRPRAAPLSVTQRQLYALVSRFPDLNRAYSVCEGFRIRGDLDVAALTASVDRVVSRHDALRTSLSRVDGEVRQVAGPSGVGAVRTVAIPLALSDREAAPAAGNGEAALAAADREAALAAAIRAECRVPFLLHGDRLARFVLYRMAADDHVLLFVVHHLVFDGWSLEVLWREIGALYEAARQPAADPLPPVRMQFADYVHWQLEWLASDKARAIADYWIGELGGCADAPTVPYDDRIGRAPGTSGRRERVVLPAELTAAVLALARRRKITPAAVMLCAWQLLIGQSAGVRTVLVGIPMSNRTRVETLGTMGPFLNIHAVRLDIADTSPGALLQAAADKLMGALLHQEMPLPFVVDAARDRGSPALPRRLYRTMFTFADQPLMPLRLDGLQVEAWPLDQGTRRADMTLHIGRDGPRMACELEYSTHLYLQRSAAALITRYVPIVRQVTEEHHAAE
jgi:hypothetical protein